MGIVDDFPLFSLLTLFIIVFIEKTARSYCLVIIEKTAVLLSLLREVTKISSLQIVPERV